MIYTAIPETPDGRIAPGPSSVRSWLPGPLDLADRRLPGGDHHQVVEHPLRLRIFGSLRQPHICRGAVCEHEGRRPEDPVPPYRFLVVACKGIQDARV